MCLNEKLTYNIKVKSRNCELFVLKKNDFLRLSVNFKEFIEKFLQKSLMKYLRFNEEKKKIFKSIDDKYLNSVGLNKSKSDNNSSLEIVDENDDENKSEEYSINESNSSSAVKSEDDSYMIKENNEEYEGGSSNDNKNSNIKEKYINNHNHNHNQKDNLNENNKKNIILKQGKNKKPFGSLENSNEIKSIASIK
jgi:hypothetical protein